MNKSNRLSNPLAFACNGSIKYLHTDYQIIKNYTLNSKLFNRNFLDVACYVSTKYVLAYYQIINQIFTLNSELKTRNSKLETPNSTIPSTVKHQFFICGLFQEIKLIKKV
jgi:hypothetical protein